MVETIRSGIFGLGNRLSAQRLRPATGGGSFTKMQINIINRSPAVARLGLLLSLAALLSARAESTSNLQFAGLAVRPDPELRLTGRNEATYEFGKVNLLDHAQIEHEFTLRNEGATPLALTQLEPTCHCTSVAIEKITGHPNGTNEIFPSLQPGEEMTLKVTMQLVRQPGGSVAQGAFIFVAGHDQPVSEVHLSGTIEAGLTAAPATLNLGPMKTGQTQTQMISITYDPRLAPDGNLPAFSNRADPRQAGRAGFPAITIEPETESAAISTKTGPPASSLRVQVYRVSVRAGPAGGMAAQLFFAPMRRSQYTGTIPYEAAQEVFRTLTVPVSGQVTE